MKIAVIGTGFIGGILGRSLARAGHEVSFGSRHPDDDDVAEGSSAAVSSVEAALGGAEVVILALPAAGVPELAAGSPGRLERQTGDRRHQSHGRSSRERQGRSATGHPLCQGLQHPWG